MHTLTVVQVYCKNNSSSPPVQEGDGEWSVGKVLKRNTLSNITVYQDMLREGRRKGSPVADVAGRRTLYKDMLREGKRKSLPVAGVAGIRTAEEEQEIRQLREQVSVK